METATATATKIETIRAYAANPCRATWREMRLALAGPECRETEWYCWAANGSVVRQRGLGAVAGRVIMLARERGAELDTVPINPSYCGRWPRTVASLQAEAEGVAICEVALAYLASWGQAE